MPRSNLSQNANNLYFQECAKKGNYAGDLIAPLIRKLSSKYIGRKVLDVGAGSRALINLIPEAIGLDLVPKHPKIIKGNIAKIPFEDNYFDTVFAIEVLEHLDNETLKQGLKEVCRVLKKGSYFVITIPFKEKLEENMVICPKCGFKFHRIGHNQSFSEIKIKNILEENNFKIIKIKIFPLGSMARHSFLKHFWQIFNKFNLGFRPSNLFVIASKK